MLINELLIKVNQLILIVLDLCAIPVVLVSVLQVIAVSICVDPNLQILLAIRVGAGSGDGVFHDFEAFIDVVVGVKKGSIDTTLEGGQSLLGASAALLNSLREFDVSLMDIRLLL